jgi:hypothetical protein
LKPAAKLGSCGALASAAAYARARESQRGISLQSANQTLVSRTRARSCVTLLIPGAGPLSLLEFALRYGHCNRGHTHAEQIAKGATKLYQAELQTKRGA